MTCHFCRGWERRSVWTGDRCGGLTVQHTPRRDISLCTSKVVVAELSRFGVMRLTWMPSLQGLAAAKLRFLLRAELTARCPTHQRSGPRQPRFFARMALSSFLQRVQKKKKEGFAAARTLAAQNGHAGINVFGNHQDLGVLASS